METLTIKTLVMLQINLRFVVSILVSVTLIMITVIKHGDIIIIITIMIIMITIIMCSHSHRLLDLEGTLVARITEA